MLLQKASDSKFAQYTPGTAFLFPGQGAQTVGMAKVCCTIVLGLMQSSLSVSHSPGLLIGVQSEHLCAY